MSTIPYKYRFVQRPTIPIDQLLTDGNGDSLFNDIVLDVGENGLLLEVTEQQFIDLFSVALNGAITTFPENWIEVIYPLIKAAKLTNDFCTRVGDCVDNSTYVQNIINNYLLQSGIIDPNSIDAENTSLIDRNPSTPTEPIAPDIEPCDLDTLWAGIREIVERIDQEGRDLLEDLSVINDKVQQVSEIIDLVPLLGDTIHDVADLFTETIPDILNAYNSASSPSFLDLVACDLFQMVCNDCRYPTYDEVLNYLGSLSYFAIPNPATLTYAAAWDLIKAVTIATPTPVWYTVNLWQVLTLAFGGKWNGSYGKNTIAIWASLGEDLPNDNWMVLCNGCQQPPFELFFDFTAGTQVPPLVLQEGTQAGTTGYWRTTDLANDALVWLRAFMYTETEWTKIEFSYYRLNQETAPGSQALISGFPTDPLVYGQQPALMTLDGYRTGQLEFKVRATSNQITYHAADVYIYTMRVWGNGLVHPDYVPYMVSGTPAI